MQIKNISCFLLYLNYGHFKEYLLSFKKQELYNKNKVHLWPYKENISLFLFRTSREKSSSKYKICCIFLN